MGRRRLLAEAEPAGHPSGTEFKRMSRFRWRNAKWLIRAAQRIAPPSASPQPAGEPIVITPLSTEAGHPYRMQASHRTDPPVPNRESVFHSGRSLPGSF